MHGTFICDFPGFPGFPVLVGTLYLDIAHIQDLNHKQYDSILFFITLGNTGLDKQKFSA